MRVIAIVPAKRRSVGLPNKNLLQVGGVSLARRAVDCALAVPLISEVYLTTDSEEIASVCTAPRVFNIWRPGSLCTDSATSDAVIEHALKEVPFSSADEDLIVVLLQPTSPLRTSVHVVDALEKFKAENPSALVSVKSADSSIAKAFTITPDGRMRGLLGEDAPFSPRQNLPDVVLPNGALYIFKRSAFMAGKRIPRTNLMPYLMDGASSIDIDTFADLLTAQAEFEVRRENVS